MAVFPQDREADCPLVQVAELRLDRTVGCRPVRAVGCRRVREAAFLPDPGVVCQPDLAEVCRQVPEAGYPRDRVAGYQRDLVGECHRGRHLTTATFHPGQYSCENFGNAVYISRQI